MRAEFVGSRVCAGGQDAGRALCGPDINCMVIINQLRGLAIWRGHRFTQTIRSGGVIAATADGAASKHGGG